MQLPYVVSSVPLLGIEIGETGTYFAVYRETASGPIRKRRRVTIPAAPDEALSLIHDLLVRAIYDLSPEEPSMNRSLPPLRLGIAFWGQLDRDRGTVLMLRQN